MSKLSVDRPRQSKSTLRPRPTVCADAAGIDLGATEHFAAVPPERDPQPVRRFGTDTAALHALADWLIKCGVRTVAMEATGVYWVPLFQVLEARGLEVCLVNARHVKNVPGRKTDVQDCQWLQYLHSVGLLHASFRPPAEVCAVRSLVRHRESLVRTGCEHLLRMQKALDQMNVQLHHAVSDHHGRDRAGDPRCHRRRPARSGRAGTAPQLPVQEVRGRDRGRVARGLEARAPVHAAPVARGMALPPEAGSGVSG